uniref:Saposin B-type domain-containing protein n=1 Tax=Strongyloides papillosus TaxID=174720 RepID=A0A0N5CGG3_STREA
MSSFFSHHLCSPCKFLFKEVKKVMPTVSKDTEQQFRDTVQKTCDRMLKTIPLLDKVCKEVTEDTIEEVFKDLYETERLIDPDEICRKMHMCN